MDTGDGDPSLFSLTTRPCDACRTEIRGILVDEWCCQSCSATYLPDDTQKCPECLYVGTPQQVTVHLQEKHLLPCPTCEKYIPYLLINDHQLSCAAMPTTQAPVSTCAPIQSSTTNSTTHPSTYNTVTAKCSRNPSHGGQIYVRIPSLINPIGAIRRSCIL